MSPKKKINLSLSQFQNYDTISTNQTFSICFLTYSIFLNRIECINRIKTTIFPRHAIEANAYINTGLLHLSYKHLHQAISFIRIKRYTRLHSAIMRTHSFICTIKKFNKLIRLMSLFFINFAYSLFLITFFQNKWLKKRQTYNHKVSRIYFLI